MTGPIAIDPLTSKTRCRHCGSWLEFIVPRHDIEHLDRQFLKCFACKKHNKVYVFVREEVKHDRS